MRADANAAGRQWRYRLVHGNVDHEFAQVDAAAQAIDGLPDARVTFNKHGLAGALVVKEVKEGGTVPIKMLTDLIDVVDDNGMIRADVRHRRAAHAQTACRATVPAHQ